MRPGHDQSYSLLVWLWAGNISTVLIPARAKPACFALVEAPAYRNKSKHRFAPFCGKVGVAAATPYGKTKRRAPTRLWCRKSHCRSERVFLYGIRGLALIRIYNPGQLGTDEQRFGLAVGRAQKRRHAFRTVGCAQKRRGLPRCGIPAAVINPWLRREPSRFHPCHPWLKKSSAGSLRFSGVLGRLKFHR